MPALYRKYRPQQFTDVVGQTHIVQTLQNAIAAKQPAHAYLFTGTRGVGKTTLARLFAKALNCQKGKKGEACLECDTCQAVASNTFLDMVEIDAASNTGVENVRDLIEHIKFQPSQGAYKVFIIDEVHMLSKQAFNALLKTLEEPPSHVVFILATTEAHKVPITIISRTQRFDFSALSVKDIIKQLEYVLKSEKQVILPDIVELIAQQASGSLRDALSLLDKVLALGNQLSSAEAQILLGVTDFKTHIELFEMISQGHARHVPALFENLAAQGLDFVILNKDFLEFLRKALIVKIAGVEQMANLSEEQSSNLQTLVSSIRPPQLIYLIRLFLKAFKDAASAPSPELPMLLASIEGALAFGQPKTQAMQISQANEQDSLTAPLPESANSPAEPSATVVKPQSAVIASANIAINPDSNLTLEEITAAWPAVIAKIKAVNSPLATLVKNSPLLSVEQGTIELEVKYRFHKEHLESKKHYALLTGIVEEVCGKKAKIIFTVNTETAPTVTTAEALGNVLQVFGGELVE